jgi:hypothetical protein
MKNRPQVQVVERDLIVRLVLSRQEGFYEYENVYINPLIFQDNYSC